VWRHVEKYQIGKRVEMKGLPGRVVRVKRKTSNIVWVEDKDRTYMFAARALAREVKRLEQ